MQDRRRFLGALAYPAAVAIAPACFTTTGAERVRRTFADAHTQDPEDVARDESRWFDVQQAFTCDRSVVNLNNGGVCPAPSVVQDAMRRHLEFSNAFPSHHLWQVLEPQKETVRDGLARLFGCDLEEIAITRNASESLQICQLGIDLQRGDEVLTSDQDYPRMLTTFEQRARREGIVVRKIKLPVPCEDTNRIVKLYEEQLGPRTKMILMCQVVNITGQRMPVKEVVALARPRGIPVVVDGAHGFANLDFRHSDLDCDYYGTSLHKWLFAPHGTGMLYVRREKIAGLWPLMAAGEKQDADIRKFEEIGTHPAANFLAIAEALAFHQGIGPAIKEARLRYLREYWLRRLLSNDRTRLNTSLKKEFSGTQANVRFEGLDTRALAGWLWEKHKLYVIGIEHEAFNGLRVTPSVHNTLAELDRFVDALEEALEKGLPQETAK
ncbi:MAG: aminotransferase class V-fold PLP-dependent enzyme [Planctomycetes bacterium]|nr:aminotransferase class V-fold PLP-dependent enzyme [Planctomycetota bacterium]